MTSLTDYECDSAKARVRDLIEDMAERQKLEIRIRAAAYRAKLKGRSYARSLGQLRRHAKR